MANIEKLLVEDPNGSGKLWSWTRRMWIGTGRTRSETDGKPEMAAKWQLGSWPGAYILWFLHLFLLIMAIWAGKPPPSAAVQCSSKLPETKPWQMQNQRT